MLGELKAEVHAHLKGDGGLTTGIANSAAFKHEPPHRARKPCPHGLNEIEIEIEQTMTFLASSGDRWDDG